VSGRFSSFNYNEATGLMLSEMDYSVCIRNERNFCGIQYTACPDSGDSGFFAAYSYGTHTPGRIKVNRGWGVTEYIIMSVPVLNIFSIS
jgi:hypothetical protein